MCGVQGEIAPNGAIFLLSYPIFQVQIGRYSRNRKLETVEKGFIDVFRFIFCTFKQKFPNMLGCSFGIEALVSIEFSIRQETSDQFTVGKQETVSIECKLGTVHAAMCHAHMLNAPKSMPESTLTRRNPYHGVPNRDAKFTPETPRNTWKKPYDGPSIEWVKNIISCFVESRHQKKWPYKKKFVGISLACVGICGDDKKMTQN